MISKIKRIISGTLSALLVGQAMIYGDGASQGMAHAETIKEIKNDIQLRRNASDLKKEFEKAADGLGEVDYFTVPEVNIMSMETNKNTENEIVYADTITITGKVQKVSLEGFEISDNTPIFVHIFDGNWTEISSQETGNDGEYSVTAGGSDVYHIKYECDGYLPFYLKDFGTGSYQVGSGESLDTITLIPGDTKYNAENNNQWSDDVFNSDDVLFVKSCLNAYRGDTDFNPSMDADCDGIVNDEDLNAFRAFYDTLDEGKELTSEILILDIRPVLKP